MVENYICHNGDLDSFDFDGSTQALETLFPLLERATHTKAPSTVDSAGVAGIVILPIPFDLCRAWHVLLCIQASSSSCDVEALSSVDTVIVRNGPKVG